MRSLNGFAALRWAIFTALRAARDRAMIACTGGEGDLALQGVKCDSTVAFGCWHRPRRATQAQDRSGYGALAGATTYTYSKGTSPVFATLWRVAGGM